MTPTYLMRQNKNHGRKSWKKTTYSRLRIFYKIIHILNDKVISNYVYSHSYVNTCIYDTYAWEDKGKHTNNIGYHQEQPHIHKINQGILYKCK